MLKKTGTRGFTLIELLVVIAIIGILSAVVLASLNSARAKGANAAVKSDLASVRVQAELYYDNNSNAYGTALAATTCPTAGATMFVADPQIKAALAGAIAAGGGGTAGSRCFSNGTDYAVQVQLKVAEGGNNYWCVDDTGKAELSNLTSWSTSCP